MFTLCLFGLLTTATFLILQCSKTNESDKIRTVSIKANTKHNTPSPSGSDGSKKSDTRKKRPLKTRKQESEFYASEERM
ncbi:hypothetical protein KIN20_008820 [Parelaphostrongylus tenuis]|uniref:Uncharacterized protein n=1 Tax=Parelaphostrongylus tenuis TaxID=148309 RepID=A0AAD5M8I6_PARTN|nr:hypothetical protein KIN20_008820 [Parelaphostrongylus tenuis]